MAARFQSVTTSARADEKAGRATRIARATSFRWDRIMVCSLSYFHESTTVVQNWQYVTKACSRKTQEITKFLRNGFQSPKMSPMEPLSSSKLRFVGFILDPSRGCLTVGDQELSLRPKSFDVLQFLARNPDRLVTKDELSRPCGRMWRSLTTPS